MAVTNRSRKASKQRPTVETSTDTTRVIEEKINIIAQGTIDFDNLDKVIAAKRKTIKVDPDVKEIIEILSNFEGENEYKLIKEMVKYYYQNNYDERAQRIIGINFNNKR